MFWRVYLGIYPPPSNSDHQDYYMFNRGSLWTSSCHCCWVGFSIPRYIFLFRIFAFDIAVSLLRLNIFVGEITCKPIWAMKKRPGCLVYIGVWSGPIRMTLKPILDHVPCLKCMLILFYLRNPKFRFRWSPKPKRGLDRNWYTNFEMSIWKRLLLSSHWSPNPVCGHVLWSGTSNTVSRCSFLKQ